MQHFHSLGCSAPLWNGILVRCGNFGLEQRHLKTSAGPRKYLVSCADSWITAINIIGAFEPFCGGNTATESSRNKWVYPKHFQLGDWILLMLQKKEVLLIYLNQENETIIFSSWFHGFSPLWIQQKSITVVFLSASFAWFSSVADFNGQHGLDHT